MDLFVRESNPARRWYEKQGYSVYRRVYLLSALCKVLSTFSTELRLHLRLDYYQDEGSRFEHGLDMRKAMPSLDPQKITERPLGRDITWDELDATLWSQLTESTTHCRCRWRIKIGRHYFIASKSKSNVCLFASKKTMMKRRMGVTADWHSRVQWGNNSPSWVHTADCFLRWIWVSFHRSKFWLPYVNVTSSSPLQFTLFSRTSTYLLPVPLLSHSIGARRLTKLDRTTQPENYLTIGAHWKKEEPHWFVVACDMNMCKGETR